MISTDFLLQPSSVVWNCTHLCPNTSQTTHLSMSTSLYYIRWLAGTVIAESKQRLLSEIATLLCTGTKVVERTSDQCQESRITAHLLQKTQNLKPIWTNQPTIFFFFFFSGVEKFCSWYCYGLVGSREFYIKATYASPNLECVRRKKNMGKKQSGDGLVFTERKVWRWVGLPEIAGLPGWHRRQLRPALS